MFRWLRHWKWFGSAAIIAGAALAYPAAMVLSHNLPEDIPDPFPHGVWADSRIGATIELLQAEIDDRQWTPALPDWHPQSHLTALPAFQDGLAEVLSAFVDLRSRLAGSDTAPDTDLRLAATLISQANGKDSADQLTAALQALRRFDGLLARAVFDNRAKADLLHAEAGLYSELLSSSVDDLHRLIRSDAHEQFDVNRTQHYFHTLGEIYAIGALFSAEGPDDIVQPGYRDAFSVVQTRLADAYALHPFLVSNPQPGEFSFGGNDMMQLAYLVGDTVAALENLRAVLQQNRHVGEADLDRGS